jgi:hypothetical protein
MQVLTPDIQSIFNANRDRFADDLTYVKNDHPSMADSVGRLKDLADVFGIDFHQTETTFTVVRKAGEPEVQVYGPNVMGVEQEGFDVLVPCIIWGRVRKPVHTLPDGVSFELVEVNKRTYAAIDHDDFEEILLLPVILEKDQAGKYPEFLTLKKAYKQGKLGNFLKLLKPGRGGAYTALKAIEPGEYQVVGYKPSDYVNDRGDRKFFIFLMVGDKQVQVMGNAYLNNKLATQEPYISPENPAVLKHNGITGQTGNGHDKVSVELVTQEDLELPTYDW